MTLILSALLLIQALFTGCTPDAPKGEPLVISLQQIDCQSCGMENVELLKKMNGVVDAGFDKNAAELMLRYSPNTINKEKIIETVRKNGFEATLGSGQGSYVPFHVFPKEYDVKLISHHGEPVQVKEHLAPGKVTVVDFFAKWCGPCRKVSKELHSILDKNKDVALRNINIVDWDRPVAKQYLSNIPTLPYVVVYRPDGTRFKEIIGLDLDALNRAITEAAQ